MTKYLVEESTLTDIADAIREQTGDENPIMLSNFASQIANISGSTTVKKYTAQLTSSQYGWFTFVDEKGNVITRDSTKIPVLATAIDGAQYFFGSFFSYESQNRYLFKVYDINNSNVHGYEGNSKTLTFDLAYVESSTISGGGHSYSTSEQIVGTWIDGSVIYEKTIEGVFTSGATSLTIPFGVNDFASLIEMKGFLMESAAVTTSIFGETAPSDAVYSVHAVEGYGLFNYKGVRIDRNSGSSYGSSPKVYITIRYTKTA